jgi:hypothetical protein
MGECDFNVPDFMSGVDYWLKIMGLEYVVKLLNSDLVLDNLHDETDYNYWIMKEVENSNCDEWAYGEFYNRELNKSIVVIAPYVKGQNIYEAVMTEFCDVTNLRDIREILDYQYDCKNGKNPCDNTYASCMKYYLMGCELRRLTDNYHLIGKIDAVLGFHRNPIRPLLTSIVTRGYY